MTKPATNEVAALARALLESAYKELLAGDLDLARASAREALEHARNTRAYAQGGSIANVLEPARQKLAEALQALPA